MAERDKTLNDILKAIDQSVARNGLGQPFICPVGLCCTTSAIPL